MHPGVKIGLETMTGEIASMPLRPRGSPLAFAVSWLAAAVDFLFGYDFFISYAHADGKEYPRRLRARLGANGYRTFLDEEGYVGGTSVATTCGGAPAAASA
jgi:hypothetical protein